MAKRIIALTLIDDPEVEKFGKPIFVKDQQSPDNHGEGWVCWYPLGKLNEKGTRMIGLVKSTRADPVIRLVESHPTREEWVYSIDKPVIQLVALSSHDSKGLADSNTAKAILLNPGQGIIIDAGVWHAPAFGRGLDEAYYGFVLAEVDLTVKEFGLVQFHDGDELMIEVS